MDSKSRANIERIGDPLAKRGNGWHIRRRTASRGAGNGSPINARPTRYGNWPSAFFYGRACVGGESLPLALTVYQPATSGHPVGSGCRPLGGNAMNELISFDFDQTAVRAVLIGDDPWWVANDVAQVLGYRDAPNMSRNLDDDEKGTHIVSTLGGDQALTIISESGLFAVILKSRKPEARRFRRWVTGDVLPALRRHGHYRLPGMPDPEPAREEFDSAHLSASVAVVREARRLFGPQSARVIWVRLGLPTPIAGSAADVPTDPLAAAVQAYLETVEATTIEEAADVLGLGTPDGGTRLRLGALFRLFGWFPRKARQGRRTVNLFAPLQTMEA